MGEWNGVFSVGGLLYFVFEKSAFPHNMNKSIRVGAVIAAWIGLARVSNACTVCMGGDGTVGEAANGAIFVMLGVLCAALGFISVAGYLIVRKGRMPLPPHAELVRSLSGINVD